MLSLNKKLTLILIGTILLIGAVVALLFISGRQELSNQYPNEHLIPNVTYYGQYLGNQFSNQEPVAVRTILNYWGNNDISDEKLVELLEPTQDDPKPELGLSYVANFFKEQGFDVEYTPLSDPVQIKALIANNVPVYVQQKLLASTSTPLYSTRIYIGYSDLEKVFIVHDNNFGNNFTITYDEFEQMNAENAGGFLLIKPLTYQLSGRPNLSSAEPSAYPPRLGIMDDLGLRDLQIKLITANYNSRTAILSNNPDGVSNAIKSLEEIIAHEAFPRLHPAGRHMMSYDLAGLHMSVEPPNYKRAIEIIENVTLPLQREYVFSEPFGEWDRKMDPQQYKNTFWTADPWVRLGSLYAQAGNNDKAREAFNTALDLIPDYVEATARLERLD